MTPFLIIDPRSGFISRYVGRTRTHKPFQVNSGIGGSTEHLLFYEVARTDPDSQGIDREAVHVN